MAEAGKAASTAPPVATPELLAFTLDVEGGGIIKLETVDAADQRRELSKSERQELGRQVRGRGVLRGTSIRSGR